MARSVLMRCPACRREHRYVPPEYPCACGAPVTLPVAGDSTPVRVAHRSWADAWTELDCPACGRSGHWPRPGFDCPCGAMVRLTPMAPRVAGPSWDRLPDDGPDGPGDDPGAGEAPADGGPPERRVPAQHEPTADAGAGTGTGTGTGAQRAAPRPGNASPAPGAPAGGPARGAPNDRARPREPRAAAREFAQGRRAARGAPGRDAEEASPPACAGPRRGPFRPLTIRTGYDAVACAAHFLRWLGFAGVRTAVPRTASGLDLRGPSVVGLVNASTEPTGDEELEVLWLHGLLGSSLAVAFSLAGYRGQARTLADRLRLPLFVLDLSGAPQPVNQPGELLLRHGVDAEP